MRFARRAYRTSAAVITAALVALSLGAVFGRWQTLPARSIGDGVPISEGSLVLVVPVSARLLQPGDTILLNVQRGEQGLRRIEGPVDSWKRQYDIRSTHGRHVVAKLPPKVWRVSRVVPYAGIPFNIFVGALQSVLLVLLGVALVVWSEVQRVRAERKQEREEEARNAPFVVPRVTDDTEVRPVSG